MKVARTTSPVTFPEEQVLVAQAIKGDDSVFSSFPARKGWTKEMILTSRVRCVRGINRHSRESVPTTQRRLDDQTNEDYYVDAVQGIIEVSLV